MTLPATWIKTISFQTAHSSLALERLSVQGQSLSIQTGWRTYIYIRLPLRSRHAGSCNGANWVLLASGKNEKIQLWLDPQGVRYWESNLNQHFFSCERYVMWWKVFLGFSINPLSIMSLCVLGIDRTWSQLFCCPGLNLYFFKYEKTFSSTLSFPLDSRRRGGNNTRRICHDSNQVKV